MRTPSHTKSGIGASIVETVRTRQWQLIRRLRSRITIDVPQGRFALDLRTNDPISRSLFIYREFELDLCQQALELTRRLTGRERGAGTVLDVGANNGVISIGLIRTGEVSRAIAVEADPGNVAALTENVALNGLEERIACIHAAATATRSRLTLELSEENLGDHRIRSAGQAPETELYSESTRATIRVRGDALDDLLDELDPAFTKDIALMWIDVQGHEGFAFQGATNLLARGIPVVSEIWPYGIARSGMDRSGFCSLVRNTWSHYYVLGREQAQRFPTSSFDELLDKLEGNAYENVLFINLPETSNAD